MAPELRFAPVPFPVFSRHLYPFGNASLFLKIMAISVTGSQLLPWSTPSSALLSNGIAVLPRPTVTK